MTYTEAMKQGNLVLPAAILFHYRDIFQSADDFLVWQFFYFQNTSQKEEMASSEIAESIGKTISDVNRIIARLTNQELLDVKTIEMGGEIEMIFDTSPAFQKLDSLIEPKKESAKSSSGNAYKDLVMDFEKEFGRYLSPFELQDLEKTVTDDGVDPDLIRQALREAVFNGKINLKYINGILRNWKRDGITTVRQVEERRLQREEADPAKVTVSDEFLNAMSIWETD
ncbi:DnaD domain-containing protein [Streptococcus hyovaginalis]|uniref:DnaD domain-containing protein n=1 Tax=Streptococcus hyovaginalis TaxID=149015 RepID=UPI000406C516|nr:DnaD domain-containing protein [Streptococcus hyovaginalis]MDY3024667.1 DnaD domain-containing protein [Streptococcus hyovaginalis]MDY4511576.1 DnaD domain-containing protein [Streptococcus hyovaginalis]MDY5974004.1 DnaD domain-containing protein [Streptococcus hyovaginalis]